MEKEIKKSGKVSKKSGERCTGFENIEKKAYELRKKGWSFMRIAKELNCSKTMAYKYVKKSKALYKGLKGVPFVHPKPLVNGVRLHNDSYSFLIHPISFWGEPNIVKLKNTKYLLVKEKGLHIQIFEKKLYVRFLEDIVCDSVDLCLLRAGERVNDFVRSFKYKGVRFIGERFEQVSRHYALLENGLAKKFVREGKKFLVKDGKDKKTRLVVDYSNSVPEFEAEHRVKGTDDVRVCESYFDDLINKPHYKPSELKGMFDIVMRVQMDYAKNIKEHLAVMQEIKEGIKRLGK